MRRIFLIITPVFAAFLFFSFLSRKETKKDNNIFIFLDQEMKNRDLAHYFIKKNIEKMSYNPSFGFFDNSELNNYILSNPHSIFVSDKIIKSDLFPLDVIPFFQIAVAATENKSNITGISSEEFYLLFKENQKNMNMDFKKMSGEPFIIDLKELNLTLHPLAVDGIFPAVSNIKSNRYPGTVKAWVHFSRDMVEELFPVVEMFKGEEKYINENLFSVIAGGDIMLARGTGMYIRVFGPEYPFQRIREEIVKHDIAFANLESPISRRGTKFFPNKGIYFRADLGAVEGLAFCGFDVISLANNHALDFGPMALEETMLLLKQKGIKFTGAGSSRREALKPAVFHIGDTSIAFICYNTIYPFSSTQGGKTMVTLSLRESVIKDEIREMEKNYDVIIVGVHGGEEYLSRQEDEKVRIFKKLVDSGADIVLGSHPHVVQEIEVYKNRLIAYSLGNLIFDQNWSEDTSRGILLEIGLLGSTLLYYHPIHIWIKNTQAHILYNEKSLKSDKFVYKGGKYHAANR